MLNNMTKAALSEARKVRNAVENLQQLRAGYEKRRLVLQETAEQEAVRARTCDWLVAFLHSALGAARLGEFEVSGYATGVDFEIIKRELEAWGLVMIEGTHVTLSWESNDGAVRT